MLLRSESRCRLVQRTVGATAALLLSGLLVVGSAAAQADGGWDDLVALDAELSTLRRPNFEDGVPQFGVAALAARAGAIGDVQNRLRAIDASSWSVAGKIDYLLVWAKANGMEFEHRVNRPWQKDPILYLDQVRRVPYVELPMNT